MKMFICDNFNEFNKLFGIFVAVVRKSANGQTLEKNQTAANITIAFTFSSYNKFSLSQNNCFDTSCVIISYGSCKMRDDSDPSSSMFTPKFMRTNAS